MASARQRFLDADDEEELMALQVSFGADFGCELFLGNLQFLYFKSNPRLPPINNLSTTLTI
jgi:hypothetical protein